MKAHAVISLRFRSQKNLKTVLEALEPETRAPATSRCKVRVKGEDTKLILSFEARDTSALRASINSYLRWIRLINDACSVVELLITNP